ncbi:hypothetical protein [Candidatus Viadribacter manganicus]|nr:hypothetical protein [Candidatus Viadribacter manganicus]
MRKLILATVLLCMAAVSASAQTPSIPPVPIPRPPGPPLGGLCTDLAIVGWNGSRSPPGERLAANEVAIYFQVRNNGPRTYNAPDDNKQWISLILVTPSGDQQIGVNVLPGDSPGGPVSLARGASWRGHVRATLPAGVTRAGAAAARVQLNYAPASGSWSPPIDCNTDNNRLGVNFR